MTKLLLNFSATVKGGRQDGGDVGGCVFALQGNKGEVVI